MLLHEYQALVREIASQTLSGFVTACMQIIKAPASKSGPPPLRLVGTIANALCSLTPLYPTTLRPFSTQFKAAFRAYVAPTASDKTVVPQTLREVSRKLFIFQHYTTPKNANAEEWAKTIDGFLKDSHATADQVFRAVQESWESSSGHVRQNVSSEGEPHGGSDAAEALPVWNGLPSGADRLIGLLETIAEFFKSPTKTSVTIPISAILDLTARITLIVPPSKGPKSQYDTQLNSAIGREEKDELWSVLPDIHVAVMRLLTALIQRLGENTVPMAADMLHQTVRISDANQHIDLVREHSYVLIRDLLILHGPTMPKLSVNSLDKTIQFCCRDLLAASGHARPPPKDTKPSQPQGKPAKPSTNADAYLTMHSRSTHTPAGAANALPPTHVAAARALLAVLPSHLPQQHLKQTLRALVDRTAVLSHDKGAMVASVLNPYRTRTGKTLASVFPFLARDFPRDAEVEVLRSNLRRTGAAAGVGAPAGDGDDEEMLEKMQKGSDDEDEDAEEVEADEEEGGEANGDGEDEEMADAEEPKAGFDLPNSIEQPAQDTASWEPAAGGKRVLLSSTLKRKSEELEEPPPPAKRVDMGRAPEIIGGGGGTMQVDANGGDGDSDSDDDVSVQLNAQLEDDDDSE